jgi:nitrite reductase/ring-hydroxylating ferredoxin subunit
MAPPDIQNWHKIAASENELDFSDQQIAVIAIDNKKLCIGRHRDQLYAFAYTCPHAGGIMADGYIDPLGNIVCPIHCYRFNLRTGRNTSGEGYYLRRWPVEVREDGVYLQM